ncbi:MAG: RdgB/HAM1 family non-canonical purine NTP pyrophosphatase [Spirochaetaceae bacterium]|nr:RdgB/HAM1 family non-canonical purine NTP pyrophosphatase [Spirochaetaceae bacterium]
MASIWIASGSIYKKKEFKSLFSNINGASFSVKIPKEENIEFNPEETGSSFFENAFIKAHFLYDLVGEPVIADDSGLCIDALDGLPGVYSARYAGKKHTPPPSQKNKKEGAGAYFAGGRLSREERNKLVLREMEGETNRAARFVCALVLLIDENRFFCAQETLEGEIVKTAGSGCGGFGYDPIFYIPEKQKTAAELSMDEKNAISHRGKAAAAIASFLPRFFPKDVPSKK